MSRDGQTPPRTNVLVVLTDQLRADCLGYAGNPDVETPHLDALAQEGVNYPNSYCTAPRCTPSRYSLLTGLYPRQHGVYRNNQSLGAETTTLPERLRELGVRSSAVGKMHLTPAYLDVGFDTMTLAEQDGDGRLVDDYHHDLVAAGVVDGNDLIDQRPEFRELAGPAYWEGFGAAPSDLPEDLHSTTWTADRAIERIDGSWAQGGQLMYLSFIKPHHPFDPPRPWSERYDPAALRLLPGWTEEVPDLDARPGYFDNASLTEPVLRQVMALYYASITHLDHHLGRVLRRLREVGADERTTIVFTADHGEYLGFHHLLLKWGKMYEPVMRVPLLVRHADRQGAGTSDDRLTSGVDVVPTVLDIFGASTDGLPGEILPDPGWSRSAVVAESAPDDVVVRSPREKLLSDPGGERYLDLAADPFELRPGPDPTPGAPELCAALSRFRDHQPPRPRPGGTPRRQLPARDGSRRAPLETDQLRRLLPDGHPWLAPPPGPPVPRTEEHL